MLRKNTDNRKQIGLISLEELVPQDHLVRQIDNAIDFNFIYDEVKIYTMLRANLVLTLFLLLRLFWFNMYPQYASNY